jgi:hypothetical protein
MHFIHSWQMDLSLLHAQRRNSICHMTCPPCGLHRSYEWNSRMWHKAIYLVPKSKTCFRQWYGWIDSTGSHWLSEYQVCAMKWNWLARYDCGRQPGSPGARFSAISSQMVRGESLLAISWKRMKGVRRRSVRRDLTGNQKENHRGDFRIFFISENSYDSRNDRGTGQGKMTHFMEAKAASDCWCSLHSFTGEGQLLFLSYPKGELQDLTAKNQRNSLIRNCYLELRLGYACLFFISQPPLDCVSYYLTTTTVAIWALTIDIS